MHKDFDKWNELKKKIHVGNNQPGFFPQDGEIWMCSLGKNIGYEQNGNGANFSRPVLVTKKFNNQMFWALSLSTKQKSFDFYHNFTDVNKQKVAVILAQLKLVSVKRLKRKLYDMPRNDFTEIKSKLKAFLA